MDDDHQLVIIATYGDLDLARQDFEELERRLKHGMELRAGSLVTKDAGGNAEVIEAANRHGRTGTLVGAGVGLLLGLVIQPVLLGVLIGGAGGALATAIAEHELRTSLRKDVGDALEDSTAVVLALAYPNGRGHVDEALIRAGSMTAVRLDKATMEGIDGIIAAEVAKLPGHGAGADAGEGVSADTPDTRS